MSTAETYYNNIIPALCAWREARNQPNEAMLGVLWVIHNRANDTKSRWPKAFAAVVLQKWQFSSFNANDPNVKLLPAPTDKQFAEICGMVDGFSVTVDPTHGANFYHSFPEGHKDWPSWATPETLTIKIGELRFYKR